LLLFLAVGLIGALGFIAFALHRALNTASSTNSLLSATQVIQLYVESAYMVLVAIGVAIGLYFGICSLD